MNAKKIMGAVLVALLAAALFVGAGAAETEDKGTVFVYQAGLTGLDGTWTAGNAVVSISNGVVMAGANFVPGTYTKGDYSLYVTYPTASYFATAGTPAYIVDKTVYLDEDVIIDAASASDNMTVDYLYVYFENAAPKKVSAGNDGKFTITADKLGSYKVVAHFSPVSPATFVSGTPETYEYDTVNALTFKVIKSDEITVTSSVDTALIGESFTITVNGVPGMYVQLADSHFTFKKDADTEITAPFEIPNTGVATIYVTVKTTTEAGDYEITVTEVENGEPTDNDASVDIEVIEGTITAEPEKESYYIGDVIKLIGTTTAGDNLFVYIEGTNFAFTELLDQPDVDGLADTWELEIEGSDFKSADNQKPDAGTYAVFVTTQSGLTDADQLDDYTYATTTVNLIQPFISLTTVPDVVIKGEVAKFIGTAEATERVGYYIFGTNYFAASNMTSVKDGEFTIKLEKADTNGMAAGQYFIVVQHMMYDKKFNIWANDTSGEVFYAPTTSAGTLGDAKVLFNVKDRQTANAAQALCDNLDSQDIDDMYVKASFIVAEGTSVVNPIPEEITKGTKLTVSGSTTGHVGDIVTVEMLSTAFAAVPKDTVGSASFIALSTKVAEDGTWEVTFDTSSLNVDEYSVSVAVGALGGATTTKINVVEGAPVTPPTDEPEQPEQPTDKPEQPTEPTTPGFGALAALAGLGAVAVLLLRRE